MFSVLSDDLSEALALMCFVPKKIEKEDFEHEDPSEGFSFEDKLTFELHKDSIALFVSCDGVSVRKEIPAVVSEENVSFCVSFSELYDYVPSCTRRLEFREERFFGFNVFYQEDGICHFDLKAFSVKKQKKMSSNVSEFPFSEVISIEKDFLLKTLYDIRVYGNAKSNIVYSINDGVCIVAASDRYCMGLYRYPIKKKKSYLFFIPIRLALEGLPIIERIDNSSISLYYNEDSLFIQEEEISLELKQLKRYNLDIIERALSIQDIEGQFTVSKKAIDYFLVRADALNAFPSEIIIHAVGKFMTIHCYDYEDRTGIHEIAPITNCTGDFYLVICRYSFVKLLKIITTEYVKFFYSEEGLIYLMEEYESIQGNNFRVLERRNYSSDNLDVIKKESNELIEKLRNEERQLINDYGLEFEEYDDEEEDCDDTIEDELREEAVARMKKVITCRSIIDSFEETGQPQVYEPPYGASYNLEDEELEEVRKFESLHDILIWGIIRCSMNYNHQEVTVDCMLYVSNDKDNWEQERKDLYDCYPDVYTVMKEYPVKDHGHITVSNSPGGTLLRII